MNLRNTLLGCGALICACGSHGAEPRAIELHQVLAVSAQGKVVALTLDACGGGFDRKLVDFLIEQNIPATVFVTRKWTRRNREGLKLLMQHAELFELENHGMNHVPAVIGGERQVYGITGHHNAAGLVREVLGGAAELQKRTGATSHWYRGATAVYDPDAVKFIEGMGYRIAGFSVNADQGALLSAAQIERRLARVTHGDIIIAHLNRPESDTAQGLQEGLRLLSEHGFHFVKLANAQVHAIP